MDIGRVTDLFGDAPRAPARPVRRSKAVAPRPAEAVSAPPAPAPEPAEISGARAVSYACHCGARDEVKRPAPDALDCWNCHGLETMRAYAPRYLPPEGAGRELTAHEREGMRLDS